MSAMVRVNLHRIQTIRLALLETNLKKLLQMKLMSLERNYKKTLWVKVMLTVHVRRILASLELLPTN